MEGPLILVSLTRHQHTTMCDVTTTPQSPLPCRTQHRHRRANARREMGPSVRFQTTDSDVLDRCRTFDDQTPKTENPKRCPDPFQVFQVEPHSCLVLQVKVLRGRRVTSGWVADLLHAPCPCVELDMSHSPEGRQSTSTVTANTDPNWAETFTFHLDPKQQNSLEVTLVDKHWYGGRLGTSTLPVSELVLDTTEKRTLIVNGTSEVDIELRTEFDASSDLRYGLGLCDEEKTFREQRRVHAFEGLKKLLGDRAPDTVSQTPTIAVLGSGGGFRAMVGFAGAMKGLSESGLLDCTTYTTALSGSAWYLSQLYSHPQWPVGDVAAVNSDLRAAIDHSFLWLLTPGGLVDYLRRVRAKHAAGQPVSFTDLFGLLVGETLLPGRLTSRLSSQHSVVEKGAVPLPLYACVHAKKDVSARVFQEWVEFSPYEVGLPKYAISMKSHLFGSQFFMGKVVRRFPEQPLHYLQGIWGSAFCILFQRLLRKSTRNDSDAVARDTNRRAPKRRRPTSPRDECGAPKWRRTEAGCRKTTETEECEEPVGYWGTLLEKMCTSSRLSLLSTRTARAGVVHNPLRGLTVRRTAPCTPHIPHTEPVSAIDEFGGLFDLHPTSERLLCLVDAGLTFNSPYPVILRPQRSVDVILSYDFSARTSDDAPPFKELLFAAKWAKLNGTPFPPIDVSVWDPQNPQEVYVFRHPTDLTCPIILHFVLVNTTFKHFKEPGVERVTSEEQRFGDFTLFDDPATPYSTYSFTYTHEAFDRLSQLTEYNTLRHVKLISDVIAERVDRKRAESLPVGQTSDEECEFKLMPMEMAKNKLRSKRGLLV